jgi:hypothetical protein
MNKKAVFTTLKIVAFGVVPYLVDTAKKTIEKGLESASKVTEVVHKGE